MRTARAQVRLLAAMYMCMFAHRSPQVLLPAAVYLYVRALTRRFFYLPPYVYLPVCAPAPQVLLPAAVHLPVRLGLAAEVRGAGGAGLQRQRATGARLHGHRQRRAGDGSAQPRGQGTYARPRVAAVRVGGGAR